MLANQIHTVDTYNLRSYMIEETWTTPFVGMSVVDNSFLIQGKIFLPLGVSAFPNRILDLITAYYEDGNIITKVRIDVDIIKNGSVDCMYHVLEKIWNRSHSQEEIEIFWYYTGNNFLSGYLQGIEISSRSGIPMTFISKD